MSKLFIKRFVTLSLLYYLDTVGYKENPSLKMSANAMPSRQACGAGFPFVVLVVLRVALRVKAKL